MGDPGAYARETLRADRADSALENVGRYDCQAGSADYARGFEARSSEVRIRPADDLVKTCNFVAELR